MKSWWHLIGFVVVVAALYAAQDVLIPIALATLLTFILTPPVTWLERRIGRVAAVLSVVTLVCALLVAAVWGLTLQLDGLTKDLPRYRTTLVKKLSQVRHAGEGNVVNELTKAVEEVQQDLQKPDGTRRRQAPPVVVLSDNVQGLSVFSWLGPLVGLAGTAGLVATLVIFMLLERRGLRERFITVVGQGHLALTTKALDEAGSRVAKQLLMQTLVNTIYGVVSAIGLTWLDVPYALVWAILGGLLRFIPYVGPLLGAVVPIIVSVAALEGWRGPAMVAGFFVVLELFTNLVLETVLYADAAGVSQVGLLVSVAFWTWLWGPLGLMMAVPLTVCLVVLGKHVPGLGAMATLLADASPLSATHAFYQRLLARDTAEATELIERQIAAAPPRAIYDTLIMPALGLAELDRLEGRLNDADEASVIATTRELLADAADMVKRAETPDGAQRVEPVTDQPPATPLRVLGYPVSGAADELALELLSRAVDDLPIALEITPRLLVSEIPSWIEAHQINAVCFADLPPHSPSRARYLVKKLRGRAPDLRIMVGRWASVTMADESAEGLMAAGANHVGTTVEQSRGYLRELSRAR